MTRIIVEENRGYLLAGTSILLVSVAQLAMKYALMHLPPVWVLPELWLSAPQAWLPLAGGLLCYFFSLVVWYFTLQRLALGKAYALLSLSYALVWLGALALPAYDGVFSIRAFAGVATIVAGVLLVCWPQRASKV